MAFILRRSTLLLPNIARQVEGRALLYHSQCRCMAVSNHPQRQFQGLRVKKAYIRRETFTTHTLLQMDTSSTAAVTLDNNIEDIVIEGDTSSTAAVTLDNNMEDNVVEGEGKPRNTTLSSKYRKKSGFLHNFHYHLSKGEVFSDKKAYAFLRSCGVNLVGETNSSRKELVTYIWSALEKNGVTLNIKLWNTLLLLYIQNAVDFEPSDFLKDMWQKSKCQPNQLTYSLLVNAYAVKGDPVGAMKVVEFMMEKDGKMTEDIYGYLVQAFGKSGDMAGVEEVLSSMSKNNVRCTHTTYGQLINVHAERGDLESIDSVIREMTENFMHPTSTIYINLLEHLSSSGHTDLIGKVWVKMEDIKYSKQDLLSLMQRLVTGGNYEAALILLEKSTTMTSEIKENYYRFLENRLFMMLKFAGKDIDEYATVSSLLERHLDQDQFSRIPYLMEFLVAEIGHDTAFKLLEKLNIPFTVQMFYPVLASYAKKNPVSDLVKIYQFLIDKGIPMNFYCIKLVGGPTSDAYQAYLELIKENDKIELPHGFITNFFKSKDITLNQLTNAVYRAQPPDLFTSLKEIKNKLLSDFNSVDAVEIVSTLHQKGLRNSRPLIEAILVHLVTSEENRAEEALSFVKGLVEKDIAVGSVAYSKTLDVLYRYDMGEKFFGFVRFMKERGIDPNVHQYFHMLKMAAQGGNTMAAQFCFEQLLECGKFKEERLYSLLISAYGKDDENSYKSSTKIVDLYNEMVTKDIHAKGLTIVYVVKGYLYVGDIRGANSVLEKHGNLEADRMTSIENSRLNAYVSQKKFAEAKDLFDQNKAKSSVTKYQYNDMMRMCITTRDDQKVNELYQEMLEKGFVPNHITHLNRIETYLAARKPIQCVSIIEENIAGKKKQLFGSVCSRVLKQFVDIGDVENITKIIELVKEHDIDVPQMFVDEASELLQKGVETDNSEDLDLKNDCEVAQDGDVSKSVSKNDSGSNSGSDSGSDSDSDSDTNSDTNSGEQEPYVPTETAPVTTETATENV